MRRALYIALLAVVMALPLLLVDQAQAQFDDRFCSSGAGAGTAYCQGQSGGGETQNEITGQNGVLYIVVDYVTTIALVAAIIVILIASIMYITSDGDPGRANRARSAIIYAMIALAISVLVREVVLFALSKASTALS